MYKVSFIVLIIVVLLIVYVVYKMFIRERFEEREDKVSNPSKVILQAYDYEFVSMKTWTGLSTEVEKLSKYYTAFWLPPVSKSLDETGYLPTELYSYNSQRGDEESLLGLIKKMKSYNISAIVDVSLQHREGTKYWFVYTNPSYLDKEDIPQDEYYKYIDTLLYEPWGDSDNIPDSLQYVDGLPPDYDINGLKNCYSYDVKTKKSIFFKGCRNKRPMYDVIGKSNPSWLQSVNFCHIDVLKSMIKYVKNIKKLGIDGIRMDQPDAISYEFISLLFNSDITNTDKIVNSIIDTCNKSKSPYVDKDVEYPLEKQLLSTDLEELTSVNFEYKIIGNFSGYLYSNEWRGLFDMQDNVNSLLKKNDWASEFDYSLKFVLNRMLNTGDLSIDGTYFEKSNMLIGNEKYKSYVCTFIDNYDTNFLVTLKNSTEGSDLGAPGIEINFYRIVLAYFIILMLPGIPMIFKLYYDIYNIDIEEFIDLRNNLKISNTSNFDIVTSGLNDISWKLTDLDMSIKGRSNRSLITEEPKKDSVILVQINDKSPSVNDKFVYVKKLFDSDIYMKISYI